MSPRKRSNRARTTTEAATLVRGSRVARHGGRTSLRIQGVHDGLKLKRALSADYRHGPVTRTLVRTAVVKSADTLVSNAVVRTAKPRPIQPRAGGEIQREAREAVDHVITYGDWRKIAQLVESTAGRVGRGALIRWFEQFGTFKINKAKQLTFHVRKPLTTAALATAEERWLELEMLRETVEAG